MGGEGGAAQGPSDFTHPPSRYLNKHGRKTSLDRFGQCSATVEGSYRGMAKALLAADDAPKITAYF